MINYAENYENIISLVSKYFSLDDTSQKEFEEKIRKGTNADEAFIHKLDNNFRLEKNLSINDLEDFDESWNYFKFYFGEYCVDTGITYAEYLMNSRTNQKNFSKISKDLKKYYKSKDTIFGIERGPYAIDNILEDINNHRLPRKKLKLVLSFNFADMFMCSTGQDWTSCLNLESAYYGAYWLGLASIPFDKNRGMIYLTSQRDNITSRHSISAERMFKRSFGLIDTENNINLLKWYPNDFVTNNHIRKLSEIFSPINFRQVDMFFKAKYPVEMPSLKRKDGEKRKIYIYQDKTEISNFTELIYSGGKGNQHFVNGENSFGPFVNCEGGIERLSHEAKEIYDFIKVKSVCRRCGEYIDEENSFHLNGNSYCESCFDEIAAYCERCDTTVHETEYNFEMQMCDECAHEVAEEEAV